MSYYCTVAGHATGEIVAPQFNPDGTVRAGIVAYFDLADRIQSALASSFCYVPPNFWNVWSVENPPAGAHMYIESSRADNGFERQQILVAAEELRNKIQNEAQAIADAGIPAR